MSKPQVTVFGAGGFIGGTAARTLEAGGCAVTRVTSREANLADVSQVERLGVPEEAFWLLAAARSPDYEGDIFETNVAIARAAVSLMATSKPAGIVHLSSIDVYGRAGLELPLHEESPRTPQSPYAESKCLAEDVLVAGCRGLGVPLLTLRLPGVYGPDDTHRGPVRSFVDAALRGEVLHVHGDGEQLRDLLYVEDVARIVLAWMAAPVTALTNAVTGRSISLNAMIAAVAGALNQELKVKYHKAPQFDLVFRAPRLATLFPALLCTPMEEGIRATCHHMLAQTRGGAAHAG